MKRKYIFIFSFLLLFGVVVFVWFGAQGAQAPTVTSVSKIRPLNSFVATPFAPSEQLPVISASPSVKFVGPRDNVPEGAPMAYGFWSFAVPVPGVLSRSGQPLISEFKWLREHGWRGDVDLRVDGERGEVGDDSKLPGFKELGFNYLYLPIPDGSPPTEKQAEQFLAFATNPINQPLHVHCRGGIGRAGTMVALYRYAVQGWPIDSAIEESRPFEGGISDSQYKWLKAWAKTHIPGYYITK